MVRRGRSFAQDSRGAACTAQDWLDTVKEDFPGKPEVDLINDDNEQTRPDPARWS